jgi:arsenical pump membrane protein
VAFWASRGVGRAAFEPCREDVLSSLAAEIVCIALLLVVLAFAVARPREWPEAVTAVPAAVLVVLAGAVPASLAWAEIRRLLPVMGFLAAVLVLAQMCSDEGLFAAAGVAVARVCGERSGRMLTGVFVLAAVTTAVLSLDATVVLLTPVVFATAARIGARPRPHVYACTHLANTASLLLPVSNLTNLLAFAASELTFSRFAGLMAAPWLMSIAVEYVVFRRFFRADLDAPTLPPPLTSAPQLPVFTLSVVTLTLAGFVLTSAVSVNPAWPAVAGAVVLALRALREKRTTVRAVLAATSPLFLVFVLALGVLVKGVLENGLDRVLSDVLPVGSTLPALLAVAVLSAALANLINNLPAVLALLPIVTAGGTGPVLAMLVGVNIGPNLTYVGSLATLLWRRVLRVHDAEPDLGQFTRLGLLTVPASLTAATVALWAVLRATGG